MNGIIEAAAKLFASLFSWILRRQDLNNSAEMQKNAAAKKEAARNDEIEKAIENKDTDKIRNMLGD